MLVPRIAGPARRDPPDLSLPPSGQPASRTPCGIAGSQGHSWEHRIMSYYISRTIESGFAGAVTKVVEALKQEGFGVLTDIDVAATMKQKLGSSSGLTAFSALATLS
jgi:hypothetical protein